jgi:hypothetical protein
VIVQLAPVQLDSLFSEKNVGEVALLTILEKMSTQFISTFDENILL